MLCICHFDRERRVPSPDLISHILLKGFMRPQSAPLELKLREDISGMHCYTSEPLKAFIMEGYSLGCSSEQLRRQPGIESWASSDAPGHASPVIIEI